jgi:hypothetical protein
MLPLRNQIQEIICCKNLDACLEEIQALLPHGTTAVNETGEFD